MRFASFSAGAEVLYGAIADACVIVLSSEFS